MQKTKIKNISLESDFTNIGFIIAIAVSVLIIAISVFMIYLSTPPEKIYLARVNGDPIPLIEYKNSVERTKNQYKQMMNMDFNSPTGAQMLPNIEKNVANGLIDNEVLVQTAKKKDIEVTSQEINDEINNIKTKNFNGDEKLFTQTLSLNKITLDQLRDSLRKSKLVEKLKKQITDEIKITDKEKKDYYEKNKAQYGQQEEVKASHILVKDQKLADEIYQKAIKGENFDALAKKYSTDPGSKDKGGDLGFFSKGRMVPEFEKASFSLKNGEISKPVKSNFGYHIIKRIDYKPAKQSSYDEVKAKIEEEIKNTKSNDAIKKFTKEERDKSDVIIYVESVKDTPIVQPPSQSNNSNIKV
ncbi:MAG: peptidylprolyl isomerase, partial [Candidatus Sericytochromatia bacterium]